jgi:DNA-binding MltR family transcriptional regulator
VVASLTPEEVSEPGPDFDGVLRLYKELDKESDRGAVLVAGAMLEEALAALLVTHFVANPTATDPLFDGPNAPLQSFSAKIDAGYRMGLFSDRFCRDLHVIRRIRNDVAHRAAGCSFQDTSIADRVRALTASHGIFKRSPKWVAKKGSPEIRTQFIEAASWMLFYLIAERGRTKHLTAKHLEFGYLVTMDDHEPPIKGPTA